MSRSQQVPTMSLCAVRRQQPRSCAPNLTLMCERLVSGADDLGKLSQHSGGGLRGSTSKSRNFETIFSGQLSGLTLKVQRNPGMSPFEPFAASPHHVALCRKTTTATKLCAKSHAHVRTPGERRGRSWQTFATQRRRTTWQYFQIPQFRNDFFGPTAERPYLTAARARRHKAGRFPDLF